MKILLAGPGTGKTTKIKKIINEHGDGKKFLILSFTNATVNDLQNSLKNQGISDKNCLTLHKFAIRYNHDISRHVLLPQEESILQQIAKSKDVAVDSIRLINFLNCTTFDKMISNFVNYAKSNPLYLKQKLSDFNALIIDEYQDFNPREQDLIDILVKTIEITYILGDDDQCIYDFKDTSADKIISLHNDINNEKLDHEHVCYRCPDKIVEHASNLILENKNRVMKEWKKSGKAGNLEYQQLSTFEKVADSIVSKIATLSKESILILTPVKFAIEPLIEKLEKEKISFINYFSEQIPLDLLKKSWEVRALFGSYKYFNLVLCGYTHLKIRKKFYKLLKKHFDSGENYDEMLNFLNKYLPDTMRDVKIELEQFLALDTYKCLLDIFISATGKNHDDKLENLFKNSAPIQDSNIKVMSIHKSKGLQADNVFIIGLVEGIIPNNKEGNDTIESQRRLFYVGMTRAIKTLYLFSNIYIPGKFAHKVNKAEFKYHPLKKAWAGRASIFIDELKL